ncbi:MAG: ATP-binding protein [Actinomycetota bacterium]|nr:ATP-binding protein [Actinomycetota bacterium]
MSDTLAFAVVGVIGIVLGAGAVLAFRVSERTQHMLPEQPEPVVPPGVGTVLSVLRSSAVVVDGEDHVLKASAPAYALGLVRGDRLVVDELVELVHQVRRDGQIREQDLVIGTGITAAHVAARVAPLGSRLVLVLVEDQTRERRVEAIRRDFVANVSHELKTPIGALTLLSEAVGEAAGDPEAVQRFSDRMQTETERLSRLVQQIIELSRLQADDPVGTAEPVDVDDVVEVAMDRSRVDAQDKRIELVHSGERGLWLTGNSGQLALALGNLVENAVAYSPASTTVVVSTRREESGQVQVTVTDRGIGIPAHELDRIFERFYRVDPARARSTGGTGLGLSIVKHVAASHGGQVDVWSVPGEGSSFTLSLPGGTTAPPPTSHRTTNQPEEASS